MTTKIDQNTLRAAMKAGIQKAADDLGITPIELKEREFLARAPNLPRHKWIGPLGSFNNVRRSLFPPDVDLPAATATDYILEHQRKNDKKYGKEIFLKDEFIARFEKLLKEQPLKVHAPVPKAKKSTKPATRSLVVHFSDTHFGSNISPKELNGINEFNWTIAARRSAHLFEQVVQYKPQYRDQTELVVLLNGDIIAGVIHDQEGTAIDELATQHSGALSIFIQGISYAAKHFKKVRVVCTPGNHGRAMHKMSKSRATVHKWDSYETNVYTSIRAALAWYPNIEFIIPESPYAIVPIQGHKYLVTHGDTVVNVGNPGRNLNMKSINEQINKLNSQLIRGDENFAAVICGHVHTSTIQETDSGTMLLVNGTLSGLDPFAQSIGIFSPNATQTLFEATRDFPVGDIRLIRLKGADKLSRLDAIIKPFSGKF